MSHVRGEQRLLTARFYEPSSFQSKAHANCPLQAPAAPWPARKLPAFPEPPKRLTCAEQSEEGQITPWDQQIKNKIILTSWARRGRNRQNPSRKCIQRIPTPGSSVQEGAESHLSATSSSRDPQGQRTCSLSVRMPTLHLSLYAETPKWTASHRLAFGLTEI